jgi:HD-GYP domain-containing protein (c-di-GMP phosphodiesterase class II)
VQTQTRYYPLHVHISTLFVVLILLVGALIGGLGYRFSHEMLESAANDLSVRISRETRGELERIFAPAQLSASLLGHAPVLAGDTLAQRLPAIDMIRTALDLSSTLSSLYIAYPDGEFFFMRRVLNDAERASFDAPPGTVYIVQSIEHDGGPRGEFRHLDAALRPLRIDDDADYARRYDPRVRDWYREALASGAMVRTAPYVFFSSGQVGTTLAIPAAIADGAVVGADILLETLDASLAAQKITPSTEMVLLDGSGAVVAYGGSAPKTAAVAAGSGRLSLVPLRDFGVPVLAAVAEAWPRAVEEGRQTLQLEIGGERWRAGIQPLQPYGTPLYLVMAVPERELLAAALRIRDVSMWATALIVLLSIPATWGVARALSGPLRALAGEAETIRQFEFSRPIEVRSMVKETHELAVTMGEMKRTIRRFLDITAAVAGERDFDRLLPLLLSETLSAAGADAGVIYLADEAQLTPAVMQHAGEQPLRPTLPPIPLATPHCAVQRALGSAEAAALPLTVVDRTLLGLDPALLPEAQAIAVPLRNRGDELVGALLLLHEGAVGTAQLGFVDALAGAAAVALESQQLIKLQRALFESFVKVIAGAIDSKSPYTGGHCSRVPEVAKRLAQAACDAVDGPYRDFALDDAGWEALHLAAWLHDCGKVTTPEHVVDKATKLEAIHDRVHEVRMRFEVLKRDAEIGCLRAILGGEAQAAAQARLEAEWAELEADFAFVAECNIGGEAMAPERLERLQRVAARTWLRTLDDRLGISTDELARKARTPPAPLPAVERLLADKPEHLFERRASERFGPGNPWGFRMDVPQWLYDRGELHNLSVERGTLTAEDRYKINEHVVQTEIMLRQLIYPHHLRNVPDIAAAHHEKMDGSGYPKRLTREQLGPLARMMAIADIFEALTAIDRPYKKGKTLSESIAIMQRMAAEQHIDDELFELFLRAGVYLDYARRFLRPEQIDEVDVEAVLGTAHPCQARGDAGPPTQPRSAGGR